MIALEHQAITDTTRLPRQPGPRAEVVRCQGRAGRCGRVLGQLDGGYLFVRDSGREYVASLPAEVKCERCGRRTMLRRVDNARRLA